MKRGNVTVLLTLTILLAGASISNASPISPSPLGDVVDGGMLVHLKDGSWRSGLVRAEKLNIRIGTRYPMINAFVAYGNSSLLVDLALSRHVSFMEPNSRIKWMTDTSHQATRGKQLIEGKVRLPAADKHLDGSGIGVAVIDTGVDGTHPDLEENIVSNVRFVCTNPGTVMGTIRECGGPKTAVELDDTDGPGAGGHGTHVAGTIAGSGKASSGVYSGAAPGASLYGVGIGTVTLVENALDGLRWVLENHDKVSPPIKVVNNSWGSGYSDPEDGPASAVTKMVDLLVAQDVTVVFAAGNSGGVGEEPRTSAQCVNPTPGVICVANFWDGDTGTRDGMMGPSSSRGALNDPRTWPDVAAPGTFIDSTCSIHLPVCVLFGSTQTEPYGKMTGTSMAAPHVAGIVAQLLQANPSLKPAQLEDVIEDTAYKFRNKSGAYAFDPANKNDSSSHDAGHGLVDAVRAARKASKM